MENKYKYALLVILAIGVIIGTASLIFTSKQSCSSESYNFLPSSNNVLISDINGNMSTYNTKKGTILFTNETGNMTSLPFPKGIIMMWNGASADIPTGWVLCDGQTTYVDLNGVSKTVPDLRGKFVVGVGSGNIQGRPLTTRNLGDTGGEENHTLTTSEMPSHSHTMNAGGSSCSGFNCPNYNYQTSGYAYNGETVKSGGNPNNNNATDPHNNMPPFYALCYICYVGGL